MRRFRSEIMDSAGCYQLCGGQRAGCEAAVLAMKEIFDENGCDAVLLVDADNAFNRINRKVMLQNIRITCPIIATYVINCYHQNVMGGTEIKSQEGTPQGDPAAMPVYVLATVPLLESVSTNDTKQAAYVDDLISAGQLQPQLNWWENLLKVAPTVGYYPKPSKSWLIVKAEKVELAQQIFKDTKINITSDGQRHQGAAIGSVGFRDVFVKEKVKDWVCQLIMLSKVATFILRLLIVRSRLEFVINLTTYLEQLSDLSEHLQPVEDVIRHKFIPALCEGRSCSDDERLLLSLPVKLGGLGIPDLMRIAALEYDASKSITEPIAKKIISQNDLQDNSNNYVHEYSDITKKKSE